MTDLRKDKRAPASLKVKYKSATVEQFMEQFGTDVSTGGIFIKTKNPLDTGALLKLELQLSDASPVIHGVGRVCWRREASPNPNLPAGMGIKFIKLDPNSRSIVDRIVQQRGARPSRFDQTEGAEIAPPSIPPESADASPLPQRIPSKSASPAAPAAKVAPVVAKPGPAAPPASAPKAAPAAKPAPGARPGAAHPPAAAVASSPAPSARSSSPGAAAVAGLFADSPLAHTSSPPDQSPVGGKPSSFFPPPVDENGAATTPPPPPRTPLPPPPAFGAARPGAAVRAEQARQSSEFLAAAFAQGGVSEPASPPPRAPQRGEDELIDQLFANVMQSRPPPAPAPSPERDVENMFAELSEEEGLSSPSQRIALPSGSPGQRAAPPPSPKSSVPPARASHPGRASEPGRRPSRPDPREEEGVDALFAELDSAPPRATAAPGYAGREEEWDGPTNDLEETDLAGASLPPAGLPRGGASEQPPSLSLPVSQPAPPRRAMSPVLWAVPLLIIAAAAGGYFYYMSAARLPPQPVPAPEQAVQAAPAPQLEAEAAEPQAQPAGAAAQPQAGAAPARPAVAAREQAPREDSKPAATDATTEIEITALPRGAEVKVDGKVVGVAPLRVPLPQGREAQVTVSNEGYASMTKAIVPGPTSEPLRFRLEPLPYELRVSTIPPEAELTVGATKGIAPGPLALGHVDGSVMVSVAKEGHQRMTRPVRLDEFREVDGVMRADIEVRLSPLPGGAIEAPAARPTHPPRRRPGPRSSVTITPAPGENPAAPAEPSTAAPAAPEPPPAPEAPPPSPPEPAAP